MPSTGRKVAIDNKNSLIKENVPLRVQSSPLETTFNVTSKSFIFQSLIRPIFDENTKLLLSKMQKKSSLSWQRTDEHDAINMMCLFTFPFFFLSWRSSLRLDLSSVAPDFTSGQSFMMFLFHLPSKTRFFGSFRLINCKHQLFYLSKKLFLFCRNLLANLMALFMFSLNNVSDNIEKEFQLVSHSLTHSRHNDGSLMIGMNSANKKIHYRVIVKRINKKKSAELCRLLQSIFRLLEF